MRSFCLFRRSNLDGRHGCRHVILNSNDLLKGTSAVGPRKKEGGKEMNYGAMAMAVKCVEESELGMGKKGRARKPTWVRELRI